MPTDRGAVYHYPMRTFAVLATLASSLIVLGGCTSSPTFPLVRPSPPQQAELAVFRDPAFAAGGVALAVGVDGVAFANLGNGDRVRALLPSGEHSICVQARSAQPTCLKVALASGTAAYLRTSASPGAYAKALVPVTLMATGYHFHLDEVPCPTANDLAKYGEVTVDYRQ